MLIQLPKLPACLPTLLLTIIATMTMAASPAAERTSRLPRLRAVRDQPTVKLVIDYGDGVQKTFSSIPWKSGMNVGGAMQFAAKHPRGIKLETRGSGATAFLTAIDGLKNRAGGPYWTYTVNGKLANRGYGVFPLKSGDRVTWKYGKRKDLDR